MRYLSQTREEAKGEAPLRQPLWRGSGGSTELLRTPETELSQIKAGDHKQREERRTEACGVGPSIRPSEQGRRLNRSTEASIDCSSS